MLQKVIEKIPIFRKIFLQKVERESKFYEQNRINVLTTYRHFLKMIPKIYPRTLQQAQKTNQLRYIYKNSKTLITIDQVEGRTNLAMKILKQVKQGDHSSLGDLIPERLGRQTKHLMEQFLWKSSPRRKYWWLGNFY